MSTIKENLITLGIGTIGMCFVIGVIILSNYLLREPSEISIQPEFNKEQIEKLKTKEEIVQIEYEKIFKNYEELDKVDIYKNGLVTPISLIQACKKDEKDQQKCNKEIAKITKILITKPQIEEAYLYIKAGASRGNNPLGNLTGYDSIYFYIDDATNYGGHLLRSQAVWSRINTDNTELLFNLSKLPFTILPYNDLVEPTRISNVIDVLNYVDLDASEDSNKHFIGSFISTLGYGKILKLKIGYKGGTIGLKTTEKK